MSAKEIKSNRLQGFENVVWFYFDKFKRGHKLSDQQREQLAHVADILKCFGEDGEMMAAAAADILNNKNPFPCLNF